MEITSNTFKHIAEQFSKLQENERRHAHGWIQAFLEVRGKECKICKGINIVVCPYPSIYEPFCYEYIYGCKKCGTAWLEPNKIDIDCYYKDIYAKEDRKDREIPPEVYFSEDYYKKEKTLFYFDRASRHVKHVQNVFNKEFGTVLDFGSGPGYFLHTINAKEKLAVEPDHASQKYHDYLGSKLTDVCSVASDTVDCICASHSLEHLFLDDATQTISEFFRILSSDGVMLIEVPNGSLLRNHLHSKHTPHTIFFTPESLDILLTTQGFKTLVFIPQGRANLQVRKDPQYTPSLHSNLCDTHGNILVVCSKIPSDIRIELLFSPEKHQKPQITVKQTEKGNIMSEKKQEELFQHWSTISQPSELDFHKRNTYRANTEAFHKDNVHFWNSLGFSSTQFLHKTILDLGAGSRARSTYFKGCTAFALEPLAQKFIEEIEWCDLETAYAKVYSIPGETLIDDLVGKVDFVYSINVIDHCYEIDALLKNCAHYMAENALCFLAFDHSYKTDPLHPQILDEEICFDLFKKNGLSTYKFRQVPPFHKGIAKYAGAWWLTKRKGDDTFQNIPGIL